MTKKEEELQSVRMLNLQLPTDPRWVNLAEMDLQEILSDHAFCEQKAASNCISLVQSYSDYEEIVERVAPIVTEEWGHFRQVLAEMKKRGLQLGRQRKDEYVGKLRKFFKKHPNREEKLLDNLLVAALIEARSCERFRLLSLHISDDELKDFYHRFMVSEAGHYVLFLDLARKYCGRETADARWQEWLAHEARVMEELEVRGDRMH